MLICAFPLLMSPCSPEPTWHTHLMHEWLGCQLCRGEEVLRATRSTEWITGSRENSREGAGGRYHPKEGFPWLRNGGC
jgi:hypothetical protein